MGTPVLCLGTVAGLRWFVVALPPAFAVPLLREAAGRVEPLACPLVYLPLCRGPAGPVEEPLFPGYAFVGLPPAVEPARFFARFADPERRLRVLEWVRVVTTPAGRRADRREPEPVVPAEIERVARIAGDLPRAPAPFDGPGGGGAVRPGDVVRLLRGPLRGRYGVVTDRWAAPGSVYLMLPQYEYRYPYKVLRDALALVARPRPGDRSTEGEARDVGAPWTAATPGLLFDRATAWGWAAAATPGGEEACG